MTNLFGEKIKKQFVAKERPRSELFSLIYFYLSLQGQPSSPIIAKRYLKDAAELLSLGKPAEIKLRCIEIKKYAEKQNISWSLNYVIKSWGKTFGSVAEKREQEYQKQLDTEYASNDRKQKEIDEAYKKSLR
jgi:hypothetical protein